MELAHKLLVHDEVIDERFISSMLAQYGWHINDPYLCFALESKTREQASEVLSSQVSQILTDLEGFISFAHDNHVVALCNTAHSGMPNDKLISRLEPLWRDNLLIAGIGNAFEDFRNLYYFHRQAVRALQLGSRLQPTKWFFRYTDFQIDDYLARCQGNLPGIALVPEGLIKLREYDALKGTQLTSLLETYLSCSQNVAETIRKTYMHRNTFLYRYSKICEITGADFKNPDTRLIYEIGLRLQ